MTRCHLLTVGSEDVIGAGFRMRIKTSNQTKSLSWWTNPRWIDIRLGFEFKLEYLNGSWTLLTGTEGALDHSSVFHPASDDPLLFTRSARHRTLNWKWSIRKRTAKTQRNKEVSRKKKSAQFRNSGIPEFFFFFLARASTSQWFFRNPPTILAWAAHVPLAGWKNGCGMPEESLAPFKNAGGNRIVPQFRPIHATKAQLDSNSNR